MTLQCSPPCSYLIAGLMVLMTAGGCFPVPATKHSGIKPGAIEADETTRSQIIEKSGNPQAKTFDGRFFLYRFDRTTEWWLWFGITPAPLEDPLATTHGSGQVLIEFDQDDTVKRHIVHQCEKDTSDPICEDSAEGALQRMITGLLGKPAAASYRPRILHAGYLAEPLHDAIKSDDVEEIRRIIDEGADIHIARGLEDRTALHVAAATGDVGVVKLLIARGAVVDVGQGSYPGTPLHSAAEAGHTAIIELLLSKGASVNARDANKATALHKAAANGHAASAALLVTKGVHINAKTDAKRSTGHTALYAAAEGDHIDTVKLLLSKGAKIDALSTRGTALRAAAREGHIAIVELLLNNGAKKDVKTLLHVAAENGQMAVAELLIARGADVNARDSRHGQTPLQIAIFYEREDMIELLKRNGAKE